MELVGAVEVLSEERSVSWRPGAEGAPRSRESFEEGVWLVRFEAAVLDVVVGCALEGAIRRDCYWKREVSEESMGIRGLFVS